MKDKNLNVSFFIPAYNCEKTVEEAVLSIMDGNFIDGDELIIVNDGSSDGTEEIIKYLMVKYPQKIKLIKHSINKGGAAARNTCVENSVNELLFCLDSDNILKENSVCRLKELMINTSSDVVSFQELFYFKDIKEKVTHRWKFNSGQITLVDQLSSHKIPSASGNYLFTKKSWSSAGGYPEFAGALDAWGFGLRQLAVGMKMTVLPNSYYFHRYGHESYWMRESKKGKMSLIALQILIPFLGLLNVEDVDYIMSREGRYNWFENLENHPIRLVSMTKKDSIIKKLLNKFNTISYV